MPRCLAPLLSALLLSVARTALAAPARDGAAGAAVAAAIGAGGMGISTAAEGCEGGPLTWASWTEGTPADWVTRLVLVRRAGTRAAITWGVRRRGGYGAVLHPMGWRHAGRCVLILQYQFGAAYTRMELYAARRDSQADMLGAVEGSLVNVERRGTEDTLRAYDNADLQGPRRCYRWDVAAGRLAAAPCG